LLKKGEFNKLIKTVGHCACFFFKNGGEHTNLCQIFWLYLDIFIFSLIKSLNCNKNTKNARSAKFCALIGCHCTKCLHKMC